MDDLQDLFKNNPVNTDITTLGQLISGLLDAAFYVAGFLAFFYFVWGAFQYITASGKKDDLQKARSRITYAIIGLIVVLLTFIITKYASEIFKPVGPGGGLPF